MTNIVVVAALAVGLLSAPAGQAPVAGGVSDRLVGVSAGYVVPFMPVAVPLSPGFGCRVEVNVDSPDGVERVCAGLLVDLLVSV
jgi:hypothetical protein